MITINFDTEALQEQIEQFAGDIVEKALRPAAFAASKVIYSELQMRVPVGETGNLKNSIYQYHNEKLSKDGSQVYSVGVNKRKAPHWHLIEYGHWRTNVVIKLPNGKFFATKEKLPQPIWVPAKPFISQTYDSKIDTAMNAALERLREKIEEIKNA